ncbi:MAG: septal ring lytic transglycosylase RlpA family protein, partial [Alphaproteobacteria bacterium]
GVASYYGRAFHGRKTANGEVFDMYALSAAHPTLPMPSYVRVTNLNNNRSVIVRVNDRGPFAHGRLIDVSHQAADMLGFVKTGTAKVRVQFVEVARLDGQDAERLLASYRGPDLPSAPQPPATRPRPVLAAYAAAPAPTASRLVIPAGRIGETVPASELANGVPFNPHAVLAGPGRYALVAPVPSRDLFKSRAGNQATRPARITGVAVTAYAATPPRSARFAAADALRAIDRLLN